ncbi:MAG: YdcF family protein [Clostridiales bacterium]|nr:YdcF family protein [Candidatus Cacconaster stercorequi]
MRRVIRLTGAVLCLLLAVWFLAPLLIGVCHIGMFYPAAVLLLAAVVLLYPERFGRLFRGRTRPWAVAFCGALGAGLAAVFAALFVMGSAARHVPPADTPSATVIVLGCEVVGERPSIMLQSRIDAAYDYLAVHPDAVCVASGGMDDDERITEAQCIREALIRRGIEPGRIYSEERSGSTAENLTFSAAVIARNGLCPTVAIASDNFHQLRAAIYARRSGLTPYALGCPSVWFLAPGYWAREVVAVAAAIILP